MRKTKLPLSLRIQVSPRLSATLTPPDIYTDELLAAIPAKFAVVGFDVPQVGQRYYDTDGKVRIQWRPPAPPRLPKLILEVAACAAATVVAA